MINPQASLLVKQQFPEFYQEEFPALIGFMQRYYEYLESTKSGNISNLRDIDANLNEFIDVLRQELSTNVPRFGRLSDAEFLKWCKQFYTARGSEDSVKFLMRAMFGKNVDVIYPGEKILKASDGRWIQEISINVTSTVDLDIVAGNRFLLKKSPNDLGAAYLCNKAKHVSSNTYELFIDKNYTTEIETGDLFEFTTFEGILVTGTTVNKVTSVELLAGGTGFFAGSAFIIHGSGPEAADCIVRAIAMDTIDTSKIYKMDLLSSGNGFSLPVYASLRNQVRGSIQQGSTQAGLTPLASDAVVKVSVGPLMRYRGFYASTRGFLSDDIKIQDSSYYQDASYVLRIDEQLQAYKNAVMALIHPDGIALWGQYDLALNIDVNVELISALREFLQSLKDVAITEDVWRHNTTLLKGISTYGDPLEENVNSDFWVHATTLPKEELVVPSDFWVHDTTLVKGDEHSASDSWVHDTTVRPADDNVINEDLKFDVTSGQTDSINSSDSGTLYLLSWQDYTVYSPQYTAATLTTELYTTGSNDFTRTW
jgi:hypothetical protein